MHHNSQNDRSTATSIEGLAVFSGRIEPGELIEAALVGRVLDGSHPFSAHRTFPKGDASVWLLSGFEVVRHHRDVKYQTYYLEADDGGSTMLVDLLAEMTDVRITSCSEESITDLLERLAAIEESLELPKSATSVGTYL